MSDQAQAPKFARRQYYIKRPFQRRFILQFVFFVVMGSLLFSLALYLYSRQTLTTAFIDSRLRIMSTGEFFLPAFGITTLCVTGMVSVLAAFRFLFFSHQIAGPLYRFEKCAQKIKEGDLNLRVKLRSTDELHDLAQAMDAMVVDLHARLQTIRHETARLRQVLMEAGRGEPAKSSDLLKLLEDIESKLEEQVSHFQV